MGLILIAIAIGTFIYSDTQMTKKIEQYVITPEVGDVYSIYDEESVDYSYGFAKITAIDSEGIHLVFSYFFYDQEVDEMESDDYYVYDDEFITQLEDISYLYDTGFILKVFR